VADARAAALRAYEESGEYRQYSPPEGEVRGEGAGRGMLLLPRIKGEFQDSMKRVSQKYEAL